MAEADDCLGHCERSARRNKVEKFNASSLKSPDHDMKVLIKKGPTSVETSLKELEENYESKPEWKVMKRKEPNNVTVKALYFNNLP